MGIFYLSPFKFLYTQRRYSTVFSALYILTVLWLIGRIITRFCNRFHGYSIRSHAARNRVSIDLPLAHHAAGVTGPGYSGRLKAD